MIYRSIYADTYYETTANTFNYRIVLDGNVIYSGKAIKMPNANVIRININKICRNYLSSDITEMINPILLGEEPLERIEHPLALRVFDLVNVDTGQIVESYMFLLDYNYVELWTGQTQNRWYESGSTDERVIIISPSFTSVDYEGGVITYTVQYLNGDQNINVSVNNGGSLQSISWTGETATVKINIPRNNSVSDTTYTVTVSGGNVSQTATIHQNHMTADLAVNPTSYTFNMGGGQIFLNISSNQNWTITGVPSWISLSETYGESGFETITLSVGNYSGSAQREGSFTVQTVSRSQVVTITQLARSAASFTTEPNRLSFPSEGNSQYLTITAGASWTASVPNWVSLNVATGNAGTTRIIVTANQNDGTTRTGNVSFTCDGVTYNIPISQEGSSYSNYLRFSITNSGHINWMYSTTPKTIEYRINGGSWNTLVPTTGGTHVSVYTGDIVEFRGDNAQYTDTNADNTFSGTTAGFILDGNIMSLINSTNFSNLTEFPSGSSHNFTDLFHTCTGLTDASNLILPATTLVDSCYGGMFGNCTSLTTTPELPATTLAEGCYDNMFGGCTSLTTAPELPATTLAKRCYGGMFAGCTSLTTAPELPATTLADFCYLGMFYGCTSLTTAPSVLPATTLANYCYTQMFSGCHNLVSVPNLPATTLADSCYNGMFSYCWSLTTAPSLPATTLANECYMLMFNGCYNLTTAPSLPATTLINRCYYGMFWNCWSLVNAPELPATTLANECYAFMFQGCRSLNYIKCLATDISATDCTNSWVNGVASAGTFVKSSSMTGWTIDSINGIPIGWTVVNDGDEPQPTGYTTMPLTFRITSDGSINWLTTYPTDTRTIEYSKNGGSWTSITSSTGGTQISVVSGDTVQFRGNNAWYAIEGCFSGTTAGFIAEGNIMSLINSTNFSGLTTLQSAYTFDNMFRDCTGLTDASNLILPATTLAYNCYGYMFRDCTNLTSAPSLPATTLAEFCYYFMFANCESLITPPDLPATTLAGNCYREMFIACTGLITAPELPATTLAPSCYLGMFQGCTSLTSAPQLPATTLFGWCYREMFRDCSNLTTAPELPATTLAERCYQGMFWRCTSLNYIKCLATDISADACTNSWVDGVASNGTFVKASNMISWSSGDSGIPNNWTVQNN